jgi:hypothetical protein
MYYRSASVGVGFQRKIACGHRSSGFHDAVQGYRPTHFLPPPDKSATSATSATGGAARLQMRNPAANGYLRMASLGATLLWAAAVLVHQRSCFSSLRLRL